MFYLFLLIYVQVCPALILYSLGYIFNPVSRQVVRTGLVYLSTAPADADIFLGKSRYKYKTPASIAELIPGRYKVTVRKGGYRPWTHIVSIEAGKAAAFEKIILIPHTPKIIPFSPEAHDDIIPMSGTGLLLLKSGNRLSDYSVFDLNKKISRPLVASGSSFKELPVISVITQPESEMILVYGGTLWNREYLYMNAEKEDAVTQITKLLPEKPDQIKWSPDENLAIFTLRNGSVHRLDIGSMALYPDYLEGIKNFILRDRSIYTLEKDDTVLRRTYGKNDEPEIVKDKIIYLPLTRENAVYNKDTKDFLYWTRREIFRAGQAEDEQALATQKVYTGGNNIRQCFWIHGGSHILFVDKDKVKLLGLVPDGNHHVEPIIKIKRNSSVYYSDETGYLYFLDPKGGRLNGLRILAL